MSLCWDRKAIVQVGQPGRPGRSWDGLRMSFRVKRSIGRKPNEAQVDVYGLSRDSTAFMQQSGMVLRLLAGYGVPGTIFLGGVDSVERKADGMDVVTTLEASDGGREFREARINRTFEGEVTLRAVLEELAAAAGLPKGAIGPVPDVTIRQGLVLQGPVRDQLDRLADVVGAQWSIQDGQLQVLAATQHTGEEAVLLTPETGLIGSPRPKTTGSGRQKKVEGIEVTSLLNDKIRPGRRFRLESRDHKGIFRAGEVEHSGDTLGDEWYTRTVGKEV